MSFDGIITKQIVNELNLSLIGGKLNKIYEPNKNELLLGIYSHGKNYLLNISIASNNYRINLTNYTKQNPSNAYNFCMLLRKHLIGAKIKRIYTNSLERIVFIDFDSYNELNDLVQKTLVIELMGKHSNIILLNDKNKIIDSMRHLDITSNSTRDIMPAREYVCPTTDKKDFYTISEETFVANIFITNENLLNYIPNTYNGISKLFIQYTLEKLNISNESYTNEDIKTLYQYIKYILDNLGTSNVNLIEFNNDFVITKSIDNTLNINSNLFIDEYYHNKEKDDTFISYKNNLLRFVLSALKKVTKKVNNINLKLKECDSMDTYRIYGELITSNLYRINNNINLDFIELENYYNDNKIIKIPLDKSISPSLNAKKFFKKYNKLKNTLNIVSIQKVEAMSELEYLESIIYELENSSSIDDLEEIDFEISENVLFKTYSTKNNKNNKLNVKKNKINKRKVHDDYEPITYTIDGFTLYVGKNNKQNDYITTKLGKNEDIWFHTKDIRGSHVLLKCNGNKPSQDTIVICAEIAAYYSKASMSSNVPVDYTFIRNVKKPSNSKPGMVIYNTNETINVQPKKH